MGRFLSRMVPHSLALRVGGAVVIVGLFPILMLLVGNIVVNRWSKGVDLHFALHADSAANSVRQSMERSAAAVLTAVQHESLRDRGASYADVEDTLRQLNSVLPEFHHLTLVDSNGRTVASSNDPSPRDWSERQVFQRARSGDLTISSAYRSLSSNEPTITFAAPVVDRTGQIVAVLLGEAGTDSFTRLVVRVQTGQEGRAFVVDSVGQVIARPDAETLMEKMDLTLPQTSFEATLVTGKESGRDYLYAIAPAAIEGMLEQWWVVVRAPTDDVYAYRRDRINLVLFGSISAALAVLVVGIGLGFSISRPLRKVTVAARRMATGDLSARVEGSSGGELGELWSSFNTMAGELQARVQDLQESRTRIVAVQEGVRREIASHLHGRVRGRLLALRGRLQDLLRGASGLTETGRVVGDVVNNLDQIIKDEVSVLSRQLYPAILRRGLVSALRSLADQFEAVLAIEIELDEEFVQRERANRDLVPEEVGLAAYRIAEEALTNVVKHSNPTNVSLRLELSAEGALRLTVEDDGQGFEVEGISGGLGLAAMQDHAGAVGGHSVVRSAPDSGTEVTATLPLAGPGAEHPRRGSWRR